MLLSTVPRNSQVPSNLSPKRDCGPYRVNLGLERRKILPGIKSDDYVDGHCVIGGRYASLVFIVSELERKEACGTGGRGAYSFVARLTVII